MLDFQGLKNARLLKSLKCSTFETFKILKELMVNAASFISLPAVCILCNFSTRELHRPLLI